MDTRHKRVKNSFLTGLFHPLFLTKLDGESSLLHTVVDEILVTKGRRSIVTMYKTEVETSRFAQDFCD